MNKQMRQFIKKAVKEGWTAETLGSGHVKLTKPGSGVVFAPGTPSDYRSIRNTERDMRRAMKHAQR